MKDEVVAGTGWLIEINMFSLPRSYWRVFPSLSVLTESAGKASQRQHKNNRSSMSFQSIWNAINTLDWNWALKETFTADMSRLSRLSLLTSLKMLVAWLQCWSKGFIASCAKNQTKKTSVSFINCNLTCG